MMMMTMILMGLISVILKKNNEKNVPVLPGHFYV